MVKAFLKAGLLNELKIFLANLALSVLDKHFTAKWRAIGTYTQRWRAVQRGAVTFHLVHYADDFMMLVLGTGQHAEDLVDDVQDIIDTFPAEPESVV